MQTFLIISSSKKEQEKEVAKLLAPFHIDLFDIQRIKPENSIGIEEIRELKLAIALKPFKSQTKAVVIEEAQKLTIEAQNALLKTLEEPPDHTIIVLMVSTNIDSLLSTVVSRCQVITLATSHQQLATSDFSAFSSALSALFNDGAGEKLALAEELAKDKQIVLSWLEKMIFFARQQLIKEVGGSNNHLISKYLNVLISLTRTHILLLTTNVNPRFTLENLFLAL